MNEIELEERLAALEFFVRGRDAAYQACLHALFSASGSTKAPVLMKLLREQMQEARQSLPAAAQRHFDAAIEAAQGPLGTSAKR